MSHNPFDLSGKTALVTGGLRQSTKRHLVTTTAMVIAPGHRQNHNYDYMIISDLR